MLGHEFDGVSGSVLKSHLASAALQIVNYAHALRSRRNEEFGGCGRLSLLKNGQQGMLRLRDSIVRGSCGKL